MIWFSRYQLTPLRKLNAKSGSGMMEGVFLKVQDERGEFGYADYFPHVELGDLSVEQVLQGERDEYFEKCLHFAKNEKRLRTQEHLPFLNHQLGMSSNHNKTAIIKLKLFGIEDLSLARQCLERQMPLRLDANGSVSFEQWQAFLASLSQEQRELIDYIEDPGRGDWKALGVPSAQDFQQNESFDFYIHKANAKFFPENLSSSKVIFSSYMGSDLGRYHCYLELLEKGDLSQVHGIHTPDCFEEQGSLFEPSGEALRPGTEAITSLYANLERRQWSCLS